MVHEWQKERTLHQNELHRLQTALELSQQLWKKLTQNFHKKYIISNANWNKQEVSLTCEFVEIKEHKKMETNRAADMSGKAEGGKICADPNRIPPTPASSSICMSFNLKKPNSDTTLLRW